MMTKPGSKTSTTRVIVTVTDAALGTIHELAHRLTEKGLTVDRVLPTTGAVIGSCTKAKLAELRRQSGVESVEEEVSARSS